MAVSKSAIHLITSRARKLSAWQPLAVRDFRLLFIGQGISLLGDQFYLVALPWLVLQLTGSTLVLGAILLAGTAPRMIFLLVGGAASDWLSPHKLMVASNTLRSVICAILTVLVLFKTISLWHLVALAAAFGTLDAFFGPAVRAFIPAVLEKDRLIAGNSLMQSAEMLSKFVGPSIAGLVVASAGAVSAFGVDTLSFVFVTGCLLSIKRKQADEAAPALAKGGLLTSIRDGLRYTLGEPALRSIIIIVAVIEFAFAGPLTVGLASLANTRFTGGSKAFGIMLSTLGGGFLLGTVLASALKRSRFGLAIFMTALTLGTSLTLLGLAPNLLSACILLAVIATVGGIMQVLSNVYYQTRAEARMRGRLMSVVLLFAFGLTPFSYLASGVLIKINLTLVFVVNGALVLAAAILSMAKMKEIDAVQLLRDEATGEV
jgi:MFS family permease